MRLVERMLLDLNAAYDGDPWHGPSLRTILRDLDQRSAGARPIPGAHSIAELLLHITAWIDIAQRRLAGENVVPTAADDYPAAEGFRLDDALQRLDAAHSRLVDQVARMTDRDFDRQLPGTDYTADFLLHGVIQHNVYHSAQIALLSKA